MFEVLEGLGKGDCYCYVLPIKVAGEEKIVFHVLVGNEVAGNSVGQIELVVASSSADVGAAAVDEHLAESPGEALVAGVAVEADAVADRAALEHDGNRRHHGGDEVIVREAWEGLDGRRRGLRRRCGPPGVEAGGGGTVVLRPSS